MPCGNEPLTMTSIFVQHQENNILSIYGRRPVSKYSGDFQSDGWTSATYNKLVLKNLINLLLYSASGSTPTDDYDDWVFKLIAKFILKLVLPLLRYCGCYRLLFYTVLI